MNSRLPVLLFSTIFVLFISGCSPDESNIMTGTLERDRIELKTESDEPITQIYVTDGQQVAGGDLIFAQDGRRRQARVEQLRAELDQTDARLAELQRGPRPELIQEARSKLEASRAEDVNANANYGRAQDIFDRDLSNQATLDLAQTRAKSTTAQYHADRAALESLLNGTTAEELAQAEAAHRSATARVAEAELNLEMLTIKAPGDAVVDKVLFELGERPRAGDTVAILLADQVPYARIYVPEPLRSRVTPGVTLKIETGNPEQSFSGQVRWVSADPSFTPYFALTEHDRSRLSYLAEVDVPAASKLPSGIPVFVSLPEVVE
jgi:HlyD family secretion protein